MRTERHQQAGDPTTQPPPCLPAAAPSQNDQPGLPRARGSGADPGPRGQPGNPPFDQLVARRLETLGLLAGSIAHDFNNLVMAIAGYASLALAEAPPASRLSLYLENIQTATKRATDLTHQLLMPSGRGQLTARPLDLSGVVREMSRLLRPLIPDHVSFRCEPGANLPPLQADGTQIRQIVLNLMANALDAIGSRPGTIVLSTGVVETEAGDALRANAQPHSSGPYAFVEVTDSGCGMDLATQRRIYDPLFTTKPGSRGYGLATIRRIVEAHGGIVTVHSAPGRGSRFRILLPALHQPAAQPKPEPEDAVASPAAETILVVDGEASVRNVSRHVVEQLGFGVLCATDGPEAVRVFSAHAEEITAVILDVTVPGRSGIEVVREIRKQAAEVSVILTGDHADDETAALAAELGAAGFLSRPFGLGELRNVLEQALRLPAPAGATRQAG